MSGRAPRRVKPVKPARYKAEITTSGEENPFKAPPKPYRSPRARAKLPRTAGERGRFLKLSVAVGILVALVIIKLLDPNGASGLREAVDTYVGGDKTAVTIEALGRAISESGNLAEVFANLSGVLSGKPAVTPVSTPAEESGEEELPEPDTFEESDTDPNELHMRSIRAESETLTAGGVPDITALEMSVRTPLSVPEALSEDDVVMGAFGLDDTLPLPFGVDAPDSVDFEFRELPFDYTDPVAGVKSSGFGYRRHPILDDMLFHYGTDFGAAKNTDILSFADGRVTAGGSSQTYGKYIMVTHGDGVSSFYAHCSEILVKTGDSVRMGQKIAKVGDTGQVTGPHLHFELRRGESILNPEYYIGR